jgi:uncharacterized protein YecE (DUF72 family)
MATVFRAGTSGYSYKEWRGPFYPEDLSPDEWLGYYASKLPAVEINNTFYRMPRTHVVETWRDSVPDSFRFVIKASRRITHQGRLKNVAEPLGYLLQRTELLGERLGAVLFQLPPQMRADLDRLRSFQAMLPAGLPVAFEFRHASWNESAVDEALADCGHARVIADEGDARSGPLLSNPLAYLRLRASDYSDRELEDWRRRVIDSNAVDAFVFFKHEEAGGGARMAARFMELETLGRAGPKPARTKPARSEPGAASKKAAPRQAAGPRAAGQPAAAARKSAVKSSAKRGTRGRKNPG